MLGYIVTCSVIHRDRKFYRMALIELTLLDELELAFRLGDRLDEYDGARVILSELQADILLDG